MTFDVNVFNAGLSSLPWYRSQGPVRRSGSQVKVRGHRMNFYSVMDAHYNTIFHKCMPRRDVFLVVCRVLCAEVVVATSSEGFPFTGRTACMANGIYTTERWILGVFVGRLLHTKFHPIGGGVRCGPQKL